MNKLNIGDLCKTHMYEYDHDLKDFKVSYHYGRINNIITSRRYGSQSYLIKLNSGRLVPRTKRTIKKVPNFIKIKIV